MTPLLYLKLGGSLITDKRQPETPRLDVIGRLAAEIAEARRRRPQQRLLIGHGSGSFGHVVGSRYGTRAGVQTLEEWHGFAATADAAARLNRIVVRALLDAGVPAWSIQPSVCLRCEDGAVTAGPGETVELALARGLTPVLFGDVALDSVRGGTIASTEEIFDWLAVHLPPQRIVLAGEVNGVYTADPQRDPAATHIERIRPRDLRAIRQSLGASFGTDVTGGMAAKVEQAVEMVEKRKTLQVVICSGHIKGAVLAALTGETGLPGTRIEADVDGAPA